jgi:serine phosphatase RsbU (regulator of sigma subunit)
LLVGGNGKIDREFSSQGLPMGILDSGETSYEPEIFEWTAPSQVVLYSDGVLEAENAEGVQFGRYQLFSALTHAGADTLCNALKDALTTHLAGKSAQDDISLMVLACPVGD